MLVPIKWLKDYIDVDASTREIANKVTDSGSHVESIMKYDEMSGLVIAKINKIRPHENADKLQLVDLFDGSDEVTIVTGAKNMSVGDHVVLAKLGAKLPGGIEIKEAEFQGVKSPGMLCGYSELGVSESLVDKKSTDGLIILDDDVKAGDNALEVLDLDKEVIEFEITPNRPDCLSIIGMAREVAAVFDSKIKEPSAEISNPVDDYKDYFDGVKVSTEDSKRFMTAVVKDVVVKESPTYIKNYLRDAGMRPINNIVDIANFIMLEYGQPLHTYDLDSLKSRSLIVRNAKAGEKLVTLDKSERQLEDYDIVICDAEDQVIGLAGIMGGLDTGVTENTKSILLESATFNKEAIRKTSKRLSLRPEASSRFEKGIPAKLNEIALKRFLHLIEETASGTVVAGYDDQANFDREDKNLVLRNARSNALLGIDLSIEENKKYLENLDLPCEIDGDNIVVKVPYFRQDLTIEADLIEEIGRLYGFQNIAAKPLKGELTKGVKSDLRNFIDSLKTNLYSLAFSEILTYSFISNKQFDKLNIPADSKLRDTVKIINPLGEDFSVMRTSLVGNMLEIIRRNLNNKQTNLRLSEIGNSFVKTENGPEEVKLMAFSLVGDYDFYYIKDILVNLLTKYGIKDLDFVREEENPFLHPGRAANVLIYGQNIGFLGEVSPLVMDNFDIEKRVYICEININKLMEFKADIIKYSEISRYPVVERDIALVVDKETLSKDIIRVIKENGGQYLKDVKLFDIYTGEQIADDKVSLAYKILFQSNEGTLKDEVTKSAFEKIIKGLNEKFELDLRS